MPTTRTERIRATATIFSASIKASLLALAVIALIASELRFAALTIFAGAAFSGTETWKRSHDETSDTQHVPTIANDDRAELAAAVSTWRATAPTDAVAAWDATTG